VNPSSKSTLASLERETRSEPSERVALRACPDITWRDKNGSHTQSLTGALVMGSAPSVDVRVDDPLVSRLHAEISIREGVPFIRDLGSRNGTFVGGVRIVSGYVPEGVPVQVGSTFVRIASASLPTAIEIWPDAEFFGLVGGSLVMRELYALLAKVARTDSTVLVGGETGTGKERVAHAIHRSSSRSRGPFVVVDCGAAHETLFESELFGHRRGAFTGANGDHAGAFEAANGGTVFLDEIAELPMSLQAKLLRALETRSVRRVGETAYRRFDARFVAATHRDLREMVNAGAFREDLYFRLAVLPITVPPLRAHAEDIPALVAAFAGDDATSVGFDRPLLREMAGRPWLGNVRELRNFVERVQTLGPHVALGLLRDGSQERDTRSSLTGPPSLDVSEPFKLVRRRWVEHLERFYLASLLNTHDRNMSAVAQASGLDRAYVYRLVRKHGL
jgi:two-component system response regulator GlrR